MPELPEVELARENLERWLRGRRILAARVLDRRVLRGQHPAEVERALTGARLKRVARRAKYLVWDLGRRGAVIAHLGMSGKFVLRQSSEADPPAVCVALRLGRRRRVLFSDQRRFGRFQILTHDFEEKLGKLGIEPLSSDFTRSRLTHLVSRSRVPVKVFLLDQNRVAGLGNIQAAEALFRAGIHPARPASRLTTAEIARLHRSIRASLAETLGKERGPEITYLEERGAENSFWIYGRAGDPCIRCSSRVRRMVQAGRSSFYCPRCQPRRRERLSSPKAAGP